VPETKPNPFNSPVPAAHGASGSGEGLRFLEAYQYVFANPNWPLNVLLVAVCQLIPVIGPMVILGYQFEVIEALHRDPRRSYPDFSFDAFVEYLKRGLWPFLVSLVVGLIVSVPLTLVAFLLMGLVMFAVASAGGDGEPVVGVLLIPLMFVGFIVMAVVLSVLMMPMILRSGLAQDFAEGFKLDWIKSFVGRTWKEILLGALFLAATGIVLMLVGLLFCGVGSYAAAALLMLAQAHIYFQLYQLFLARGGDPIPLGSTVNK
jgi:hypothetical protein